MNCDIVAQLQHCALGFQKYLGRELHWFQWSLGCCASAASSPVKAALLFSDTPESALVRRSVYTSCWPGPFTCAHQRGSMSSGANTDDCSRKGAARFTGYVMGVSDIRLLQKLCA